MNEQEHYLMWVGAQVLQQQAAAQQQQAQPVDLAVAQANRTHQILAERARRAQERETAAARERLAAFVAQREREREKEQAAQAAALEQEAKQTARAEWLLAGNLAADFEKQWHQQYLAIQRRRVEEIAAATGARYREMF